MNKNLGRDKSSIKWLNKNDTPPVKDCTYFGQRIRGISMTLTKIPFQRALSIATSKHWNLPIWNPQQHFMPWIFILNIKSRTFATSVEKCTEVKLYMTHIKEKKSLMTQIYKHLTALVFPSLSHLFAQVLLTKRLRDKKPACYRVYSFMSYLKDHPWPGLAIYVKHLCRLI